MKVFYKIASLILAIACCSCDPVSWQKYTVNESVNVSSFPQLIMDNLCPQWQIRTVDKSEYMVYNVDLPRSEITIHIDKDNNIITLLTMDLSEQYILITNVIREKYTIIDESSSPGYYHLRVFGDSLNRYNPLEF